jgi:hypothetical protein
MDIRVASVAKAKLVYNKNKETYRILVAFNVTERTELGVLKFPAQTKCAFVSGDFVFETLQDDVNRVMQQAKEVLCINNIEMV